MEHYFLSIISLHIFINLIRSKVVGNLKKKKRKETFLPKRQMMLLYRRLKDTHTLPKIQIFCTSP